MEQLCFYIESKLSNYRNINFFDHCWKLSTFDAQSCKSKTGVPSFSWNGEAIINVWYVVIIHVRKVVGVYLVFFYLVTRKRSLLEFLLKPLFEISTKQIRF